MLRPAHSEVVLPITQTGSMKAVVLHGPGNPDVLKVEDRPIPRPADGWVLIRVKAFGLNRSELFTRQGLSPPSAVTLPRILGIEATGIVEDSPSGEFDKGDVVITAMGGMGRLFDGGYAEYTCVPTAQVQKIRTSLSWELLGACGEMLQTAYGSLFFALRLQKDETLLIRGGTTSVGLAASAIARKHGVNVISTTRNAARIQLLQQQGASATIIDNGQIAQEVKKRTGGGVDKVLELIGTTTLLDSLLCTKSGGQVCMTGMVGNSWTMQDFSPMGAIPSGVSLTTYSGGSREFMRTPLQDMVQQVEQGELSIAVGKSFRLEEIAEAHRVMENSEAKGKLVVLP